MRKGMKKIVTGIFGLLFLGSLASCGCGNDYTDGGALGKANDTSSTFYQVRKYYCEQYVYDFNKSLVEDGQTYATLKSEFESKFIIENNKVVKCNEDNEIDGHYLFTYYGQEKFTQTVNKQTTTETLGVDYTNLVDAYVVETGLDIELYTDLLNKQAYGSSAGEATRNGYFPKVEKMDYDEDDGDKLCTSVKSALQSHYKAGLVFDHEMRDPQTGIMMPVTTWKSAWSVGLLYGLFVYPIAWLINFFVVLFGGTGWGQVWAILVVTVLLKIAIFLLTFRSQASTQKMQDIQPELLKLQAKYGQNPSPEEKQKMSMEMMALYKKYGVKPLAPFASMLITFPVFIAMYRAVNFLAVLRTGSIAGVTLGYNLSEYIIGNFKFFALVIFILMGASQILSMKLPTFLNRKRMTKEAKEQQKQANMMTNVMMIMILVMGFFMPVVMSIYWIASAIVAAIQQVIMHYVNNANSKKKGEFKPKKVEQAPIKIPQGYKK